MLDITKEEMEVDDNILGKINNICQLNNLKAIVINGCIEHIKHTNVAYVEPHKIIIKNTMFLIFNNSDEIFINYLNTKIKLSSLRDYIKEIFSLINRLNPILNTF